MANRAGSHTGVPSPPASRQPLGSGYRRLWTSSSLSNLADGIVKVALPLPWLLVALPAGALADRVDRRRFMLGANAVRAALLALLTLSVVAGIGSIWLLYGVALGIGVAETIYDTAAQSILPQVVPRDRLARANGRLLAAELTANEFVGPPLGGLLVAAGVAAAFATPAALWVAAVGTLLFLRGGFSVPREAPTTLRAD